MLSRHRLASIVGWVSLVGLLLIPGLARAQTMLITWDNVHPIRKVGLNAHPAQPYWISHADCLADDTFTFNINIVGSGDIGTLEVWASITGQDCSFVEARNNTTTSSAYCYPVFYAVPQNVGSHSVTIRVQDILDTERVAPTSSIGHGDATTCTQTGTSGAAVGVTLCFVLVRSGTTANNFAGAAPKYATKYDLGGPPAPTGVSAEVRDNRLFVQWNPSGNADLVGYQLYCTPSEPSDGSACHASALVSASVPDAACGTDAGSSQSSATTSPLAVGTEYAVAVAGYDLVGNVGPLSSPPVCQTPVRIPRYPVEGRAGCATVPRGSPWSLFLVAGAGLGCAVRRRRRPPLGKR
jgi:hypothetical protein